MGIITALGTSAGLGTFLGGAATAGAGIGSAALQSRAARSGAQLQSDASYQVAQLASQTAADQLEYIKNQERMDRGTARWASRQNYGLSKARDLSDFYRFGDTATNRRAELVSAGLTEDKRYGATQNQLNTMRALMGMPNKELSAYVRPDALRLTAPTLPEYVEDPTQYTVDDDVVVDPLTNARRRV
jgi:hypothetical protein